MRPKRLTPVTLSSNGVIQIFERQVERIDALFVQSATALTSGPGRITLHGLTDSTLYFADRPRREIGHIPSRRFVALWDAGVASLALDPPNAVLSFLDEDDDAPEDAVVVLRDPHLEGATLSYNVDVLDGTLPVRAGPCSLFIDIFGRSRPPISVTGPKRSRWHASYPGHGLP
jgi:hypothetical protein